jgi:hypothetical protein
MMFQGGCPNFHAIAKKITGIVTARIKNTIGGVLFLGGTDTVIPPSANVSIEIVGGGMTDPVRMEEWVVYHHSSLSSPELGE